MIRVPRVSSACAVLAATVLCVPTLSAQTVPTPPASVAPGLAIDGLELRKLAGRDPLAGAFFSPEVVMRNQQAINLTAEQRTAIVAAISAAQPRFVEAQWQMEPENAALAELLNGATVDEQAVLRQIDRVLDIERQIKRIQIEMLVRIKNELSAEQQQQLARLGGARGLGGWGIKGLSPAGSDVMLDLLRGGMSDGQFPLHDWTTPFHEWPTDPLHDWGIQPLLPGAGVIPPPGGVRLQL